MWTSIGHQGLVAPVFESIPGFRVVDVPRWNALITVSATEIFLALEIRQKITISNGTASH